MTITNKNYRQFLDTGIIELISEDQLKMALNNVKGKYRKEGRALLIVMYYTGARPIEILGLKSKDITKQKNRVLISLKTAKRGVPRTIQLKCNLPMAKELYDYAASSFGEALLFYHFRNEYVRKTITKKGEIRIKTSITDKLRYYFKIWFMNIIDISPYYLRHSRFSKLAQKGASDRLLMQMKGAKDSKSIQPYIHMSKEGSDKLAKMID